MSQAQVAPRPVVRPSANGNGQPQAASKPVDKSTKEGIVMALATKEISTEEALKLLNALKPPIVRVVGISRQEFKANAVPVDMVLDGTGYTLSVKEFSTGSFGWGFNGKVVLTVGKEKVRCQASINVVVANSKDA